MKFDSIKFMENAIEVNHIDLGYSDAEKFSFIKEDKKYFLKIGKFEIREDLEIMFSDANINHPKIVDYGKYDNDFNYIIEEYIEGETLKNELSHYHEKFIYEYGFKIGKQYSNLRKIYKDKEVPEDFLVYYKTEIDEKLEEFSSLLEINESVLGEEYFNFLNFCKDFLLNNFNLIEKSVFVCGHTDVKPSNFIINNGQIYAVDFEYTDYKEISLSLLCSYVRKDYNDAKNLSFAKGYLDGLFNLDISSNILDAFNYTFILQMVSYFIKYLESEKYEKLFKLINHVRSRYIRNGKVILSEKLNNYVGVQYFPKLKNYDFTLVNGSYDYYNYTFKCTNCDISYFLKIFKINEKKFNKILLSYNLLEKANVPISRLMDSGVCKKDECYYVLLDFINYEEMNKDNKFASFDDGFKYGQIVASYLKNIKGIKCEEIGTYNKDDLYLDIINHVNRIYDNSKWQDVIKWTKEDILRFVDHYIKFFDDESIDLIHADIKFGNILHGPNDEIVFVDNESFKYSYDVINFLYNIQSRFKSRNKEIHCGFLVGYLKYMNGGVIPRRIEGQIKLLLLYYLIRTVLAFLEKVGSSNEIDDFIAICEKYIERDCSIEWLE